jgi:hypothetical protein
MAALAQTPGPLYLDARGTWKGRQFTVMGRVRYQYAQGFWDEWMVSFSDGDNRWIGEDEAELTIMRQRKSSRAQHFHDQATPGKRINLGERAYHVDEKSTARCVGGEGHLPFVIAQDDEIGYVELSAGKQRVATIEVSDGDARLYMGTRLRAADLLMDVPLDESARKAFTSGLGTGDVVAVTGDKAVSLSCMNCGAGLPEKEGEAILNCEYCDTANESSLPHTTCPSCDTSFVVPGGNDSPMRVCPKCSTFLDCSGGEVRPIDAGVAPAGQAVTPFKMGHRCTLQGDDYVLTGHVRTRQQDECGVYYACEYFLYSESKGYRFLEEENGHWTLSERLTDAPEMPHGAEPKTAFKHDGQTFKVFEAGSNKVDWVNGQLPYVARFGDSSSFVDCINPPLLLSQSKSEGEVEYFLGSYLQPEEIAEGFDLAVDDLPVRTGVGMNQPYVVSAFRKFAAKAALVAALVNLVVFLWASAQGNGVASLHLDFAPPPGEAVTAGPSGEFFTDLFTVAKANTICELVFQCDVHNNWAYIDVAVVNDKGEAVHEFGREISYYEGYEGGEQWSEGSQTATVPLMFTEPGNYRLLMRRDSPSALPVGITVSENIVLTRYTFYLMLGAFLWVGIELMRRFSFNSSRWPKDEDDDD